MKGDEQKRAAGEADAPDTIPDTNEDGELLEALEWLKRAGIVSVNRRPAFADFFKDLGERGAP